jgi:hypothetical protein
MEESSLITWMSSNVNIVTDTTTKAKCIIALEATKELDVVPSVLYYVVLLYDNSGNIVSAKKQRSHQKTKFIRCHLI